MAGTETLLHDEHVGLGNARCVSGSAFSKLRFLGRKAVYVHKLLGQGLAERSASPISAPRLLSKVTVHQ